MIRCREEDEEKRRETNNDSTGTKCWATRENKRRER
jgi:hypothetical protein